jgi:HEAT repeat protein
MAAIETLRKSSRKNENTIVELANQPERDVRVLGCTLIGATKPAGAVKVLIERTRDGEPNVREAACAALGRFRTPQAVKGLTEALSDEPWIAYAAACSLGEIGGKQACRQLIKLLHDDDDLKATAACQALSGWDDSDVADEIVKTIGEWPNRKRERFVRIILAQGSKTLLDRLRLFLGNGLLIHLQHLIDADPRTPLRLLKVIAGFANREAVGLILKELAKRDPDEEDFPDILALLADLRSIWGDRPEAYFGSAEQGFILPMIKVCAVTCTKLNESTLDKLLSLPSIEIRRELSRSLTLIAEPPTQFVEGLLFDADDHIKGDAAEAAAFFGMDELSQRIEELARNGYTDTRKKAFRSLCILNSIRARGLAEEFVLHGNGEDKKIYLSAVELMDKELNQRLIKRLLHSREKRIAAIAVTVSGRLIEHDGGYCDLIGEMLRRKKVLPETLDVIKQNRLSVFQPRLVELLDELHNDPWTRYQALSALAVMEDRTLFDVFAIGLKDEHDLVKIASIKALARLRETRAADLISPFLTNADANLRRAAEGALDSLMSGNELPLLAGKS